MASLNDGLDKLEALQYIPESVVALGRIENTMASPSRLKTTGQQMVASPMVAASSGTGIMNNVCGIVRCDFGIMQGKLQLETANMKYLFDMIGHH